MRKALLIFTTFSIIIIGCKKNEDSNLFYWDQTQCADPWNTGEGKSNQETKTALTDYLNDNNVSIIKVDFDNKSPLDDKCESCGCGTGQRIIVEVENGSNAAIEDLGFYK